jgi:probable phosphoglycerate mutase
MLRIVLIQPGATDFDEQGRIKGTLDIPLSENGTCQVARTVGELAGLNIEHIYAAPGQSTQQTAAALADSRGVKVKHLRNLKNLDHGLWHGKLIAEVKQTQPKVYRQWQEHPETVCPPGGETLESARKRVRDVLARLLKKHKSGVVALVVAEPLASLVRSYLEDTTDVGDLWKAECDCGGWELIEIQQEKVGV